MKKLSLLLLLPFFMLSACSDSDDVTPTTEPEKGDEMTIEQIAGTYKATYIKYANNKGDGFFNDDIELTFKTDKTGEEFNPRTLERIPFTWNYKDRIISFSYSLHKNINGWFEKSNICYNAYYINENNEQTNTIAKHIFIKK